MPKPWIWVVMLFIVILMGYHFFSNLNRGELLVSFTDFTGQMQQKNIESLKETETSRYLAVLHTHAELAPLDQSGQKREVKKILFDMDNQDVMSKVITQLTDDKVQVVVGPQQNQVWFFLLVNILPILLLVGIFWYMSSRVRRQMGPGLFGRFTGNRARRFDKGKDPITFEEVAGLRNVKTELQEIVDFLKNPERFTAIGAKIPKGVLLVGPPGTGKTLLARAVAGEAGVPFFSISGSEFIELFVGVGASRVRELFEEAKKNSPCIVFIDEIDAVGRTRGTGLGGGHDEREQTLNQILSEMDGFEGTQAVIVLAATNRPDVLDPALVRPGRFDRQVVVERPQKEGRRAILKVHTRKIPLAEDVDLERVARGTIGFSGADLQNLANEAALLAAREGKKIVYMRDFEVAKDKILLGTLRDETMNARERKLTAYHEAGHALLTVLLPDADPLHSVTIIPRGRALGVSQQIPEEDRYSATRKYLSTQILICLGGRAAEELIFNEFTTGAENDLERATELSEKMICRWGMNARIGPVSLKRGAEHVFLGRELGEMKTFSEHTAMLIDEEIRRFLDESYRQARELLAKERDRLVKLAETLVEKEVLSDHEVYELLALPKPERLLQSVAAAKPGEPPPPAGEAKPVRAEKEKEIDPRLLGLEGA